MKSIVHVIISLLSINIFLAAPAFAGSRIQSCGVKESLENINYYLTNSFFATPEMASQVTAYQSRQPLLADFRKRTNEIFEALVYFSTSRADEKKLIVNFEELAMLANNFVKGIPFPDHLSSQENQRLGGDHSNLNQLIITAIGVRACLNK